MHNKYSNLIALMPPTLNAINIVYEYYYRGLNLIPFGNESWWSGIILISDGPFYLIGMVISSNLTTDEIINDLIISALMILGGGFLLWIYSLALIILCKMMILQRNK